MTNLRTKSISAIPTRAFHAQRRQPRDLRGRGVGGNLRRLLFMTSAKWAGRGGDESAGRLVKFANLSGENKRKINSAAPSAGTDRSADFK